MSKSLRTLLPAAAIFVFVFIGLCIPAGSADAQMAPSPNPIWDGETTRIYMNTSWASSCSIYRYDPATGNYVGADATTCTDKNGQPMSCDVAPSVGGTGSYLTQALYISTGYMAACYNFAGGFGHQMYTTVTVNVNPCPTAMEAAGSGKILYTGSTRRLNLHGYNYCYTNNSGAHLFVPSATAAELESFINGLPQSVSKFQ